MKAKLIIIFEKASNEKNFGEILGIDARDLKLKSWREKNNILQIISFWKICCSFDFIKFVRMGGLKNVIKYFFRMLEIDITRIERKTTQGSFIFVLQFLNFCKFYFLYSISISLVRPFEFRKLFRSCNGHGSKFDHVILHYKHKYLQLTFLLFLVRNEWTEFFSISTLML